MLAINLAEVVTSFAVAYVVISSYPRGVIISGSLLITTLALLKMKKNKHRPLLDSPDDSKVLPSQFASPPARERPQMNHSAIEMGVKLNSD
jgi:hypothetical protein